MEFKQYLGESLGVPLYKDIIKQCQPWFDEAGDEGYIMYRGAIIPRGGILIKHTYGNRKPLDSSHIMHEALDLYFLQAYGHRWRSDHVTFSSPSESVAEQYGPSIGIVLPIGTFKYIWSPQITDLYKQFNRLISSQLYPEEITARTNLKTLVSGEEYDKNLGILVRGIARIFEEGGIQYTGNNLVENTQSEIMINCQSYYLININADIARDIGYY